jgi:glutathione S-transferase
MLAGPWVMGERYTMCDPYLFTLSQWLEGDGVDRARFPKLAEHTRRIKERPAVQRALAGEA